jgi:hypothetical protein
MSALFFMPWIESIDPMADFGDFRLIAYEREAHPGAALGYDQDVVDTVIGNYGDRKLTSPEGHPRPVQRATIIQWVADTPATVLTDEDVQRRMTICEWLKFACLSRREFAGRASYCNSDDLTVIGQPFDLSRPGGVAITTRRRDGRGMHYMHAIGDAPLFPRPPHAHANRVELDVPLMHALLRLEDDELSSRLTEAIRLFIRANSDSPAVDPASELTSMRSAFDELLSVGHLGDELRKAFLAHFSGELADPPKWFDGSLDQAKWSARWPKATRPLDAWVRDFCAARNQAAHGRDPAKSRPDTLWSIHNHLLFASWLFPLVVKKVLADAGVYALSDTDRDARSAVEMFFAHDILAETAPDSGKLWWSEVEDAIRHIELGRAIRRSASAMGLSF